MPPASAPSFKRGKSSQELLMSRQLGSSKQLGNSLSCHGSYSKRETPVEDSVAGRTKFYDAEHCYVYFKGIGKNGTLKGSAFKFTVEFSTQVREEIH